MRQSRAVTAAAVFTVLMVLGLFAAYGRDVPPKSAVVVVVMVAAAWGLAALDVRARRRP
ncbi:hypothetical protein FB554_0688 [Barrientosiimonas humi]|uniref:Uncharacterized protein n=1 Tax=Barrientosiimonas humi TaxID=999931 RepID=A0A542X9Q1_9MICO|nr:hypothetical protein [Barrientosiimonas humi]TQL32562.1 hypothetical protein FB554_0688 [Barrientosiimonas humi]CAG7572554.1 hypothetical protein BH39T_PBIAJDOK_01170 [Barrientosiimonas humi]